MSPLYIRTITDRTPVPTMIRYEDHLRIVRRERRWADTLAWIAFVFAFVAFTALTALVYS